MSGDNSAVDELEWINMTATRVDGPEISSKQRMGQKFKENPFIPIGLLGTTAFLIMGLRALKKGDSAQSQSMMRGRVLAQGATVLAMVVGFVMQGAADNKRRFERNSESGGD